MTYMWDKMAIFRKQQTPENAAKLKEYVKLLGELFRIDPKLATFKISKFISDIYKLPSETLVSDVILKIAEGYNGQIIFENAASGLGVSEWIFSECHDFDHSNGGHYIEAVVYGLKRNKDAEVRKKQRLMIALDRDYELWNQK